MKKKKNNDTFLDRKSVYLLFPYLFVLRSGGRSVYVCFSFPVAKIMERLEVEVLRAWRRWRGIDCDGSGTARLKEVPPPSPPARRRLLVVVDISAAARELSDGGGGRFLSFFVVRKKEEKVKGQRPPQLVLVHPRLPSGGAEAASSV